MALVCLMTMIVSANAQVNGWEIVANEADELLGIEDNTSFIYRDGDNGSLVFWDNDGNHVRIIAPEYSFFERTGTYHAIGGTKFWGAGEQDSFFAVVGFYDTSDKLIKKKKSNFIRDAREFRWATTAKGDISCPKNLGGDIIKFLQKNKGYVRIVAHLHLEGKKFDIKVPCMNN